MFRRFWAVIALVCLPQLLLAQGADVAFKDMEHDASAPIEIESDKFSVDQSTNLAVFLGNVLVVQGLLRLSADQVNVEYASDESNDISAVIAVGNVTFVNGAEAAEAQRAEYTLATNEIVMTGDVLVTQGRSALSGQKMVVNLETGKGEMIGRVKTILRSGNP
ncbi:MAG: lipopolysaccharide transport periplasmic protein LptA [Paracoccaceae bacterium]|nr:lipopolysaccharide transport periplasmic protein LptA [Paracoccaceae bacterium]